MKLCVALDNINKDKNLHLARELKAFDIWLKVGLRSYIRDGKDFLKELKEINPNFKIFLDLKLYDIPNTMADAAEEIAKLDIDMFNIHASAGKIAMNEVMKRLDNYNGRPLVLAVTALTSFEDDDFKSIYGESIKNKANQFSIDAYESKLDGVVCSAFESEEIKNCTHQNFITLTPGIRPFNEDAEDQKRVANLELTKQNNIDFIVVGRPIYKSNNPFDIVKKILNNL